MTQVKSSVIPKPSAHYGLRHIALRVSNIEQSEFFYKELGFQEEWRPDPKNLYLTSGSDNLALHEMSVEQNSNKASLDHFGILVKTPQAVDEWHTYLAAKHVTIFKEPCTHRDGARSFYFYDPDQNMIQIIFHPPISKSL